MLFVFLRLPSCGVLDSNLGSGPPLRTKVSSTKEKSKGGGGPCGICYIDSDIEQRVCETRKQSFARVGSPRLGGRRFCNRAHASCKLESLFVMRTDYSIFFLQTDGRVRECREL